MSKGGKTPPPTTPSSDPTKEDDFDHLSYTGNIAQILILVHHVGGNFQIEIIISLVGS
jgi:hypothetical protein